MHSNAKEPLLRVFNPTRHVDTMEKQVVLLLIVFVVPRQTPVPCHSTESTHVKLLLLAGPPLGAVEILQRILGSHIKNVTRSLFLSVPGVRRRFGARLAPEPGRLLGQPVEVHTCPNIIMYSLRLFYVLRCCDSRTYDGL